MTKFKNIYRVESARLKDWDYSSPWWYYITINCKNHVEWFGRVNGNEVKLSELGKIVEECWQTIPKHFPNAELDYYVIMPNHIHGIVIINPSDRRDVACNVSTEKQKNEIMSEISPKENSLSVIIRSFKSAVSKNAHEKEKKFDWQARYYDRIIRNEKELLYIRKYISQNPLKWEYGKNVPENLPEL